MTQTKTKTKTDPKLGAEIAELLRSMSLEGPYKPDERVSAGGYLVANLTHVLQDLGLDLAHPSTKDTLARVAKMWLDELTRGIDYDNFPAVQVDTESVQDYDEVVLIRDIEVMSLCEHHFVPVIGRAHIGYIPDGVIMGLSKFNRIVEFFSRRPQLQERMTRQISATLQHILQTKNVGVIIEADHLCVRYRGIQDPCSDTVTSSMEGVFRTKPEARNELLQLIALKGRTKCS